MQIIDNSIHLWSTMNENQLKIKMKKRLFAERKNDVIYHSKSCLTSPSFSKIMILIR